jgi:cytochrome c553
LTSLSDFDRSKNMSNRRNAFIGSVLLTVLWLSGGAMAASQATGPGVFKYCKGCHGARAMGGDGGKYPRLAGLPQGYIERQLEAFKDRTRVNKPMIPIFKNYRFDEEVIAIVARYIAEMTASPLNLWPYDVPEDALSAYPSKQAFAEAGAGAYREGCAECHGGNAQGLAAEAIPPLTNQYPRYIEKQIDDFAAGARRHEEADHCGSLDGPERQAVLHHLVELGRDAP